MQKVTETTKDQDLIASLKSGEARAFDMLVIKYQDKIVNLCWQFIGNYDDAVETAQDVFVKVYKSLDSFRSDAAFSSWIYRIAVNTCKDRIRTKKFKNTQTQASIQGMSSDEITYEVPDSTVDPALIYEKQEIRDIIIEAIKELPDPQDVLLMLRDIQGMSYEEIHEITGIKLGTIKSKISRGRETLRVKLKEVLI